MKSMLKRKKSKPKEDSLLIKVVAKYIIKELKKIDKQISIIDKRLDNVFRTIIIRT